MPDPSESKASFKPSSDVDISKFYGVPWAREKRNNRKRRNRKRRIKANF